MWFWIIALVATILGGSICGIVAIVKQRSLRSELQSLRWALAAIEKKQELASRVEGQSTATDRTRDDAVSADGLDGPVGMEKTAASRPVASGLDPSVDAMRRPVQRQPAPKPHARSTSVPPWIDPLLSNLRDHWMIWLGGGCVTLAGIFLVRYSIESGLLGPTARVVFAILLGIACHGTSEFLRQKTGGTQLAFSALAGAGSITVYAALLAATRMYELIEPGTAFILMALVAGATMAMALIHGPVLAAFGILGAYLVPILLSTVGADILIALIYALIVSASALLLLRHVYRPWLWWGFVTGALGWWALSLGQNDADGLRTLYLTVIAYLMAAVPQFDWLLRVRIADAPDNGYDLRALFSKENERQRSRLLTYVLLSLAVAVSVLASPTVASPWLIGLPFFLLSLLLAGRQASLYWLPWWTVAGTAAAWFLARFDVSNGTLAVLMDEDRKVFLAYLAVYALTAMVFSLWQFRQAQRTAIWASLASLAPMLLLTLAYLLIAPDANAWFWGLGTAVFAAIYMAIATSAVRKKTLDSLAVWLFVGGHYGLALAAAMVFEAASLTIAIAAQIVSLAWIIRTFGVPGLGWLLKLVVMVVIARLTFNPWLLEYTTEAHWSLWTYGGSTVFAALATRLLTSEPRLAQWAEGAALHLLVLTVWSELRYQLYDGAVYASEFTFVEAAVLMFLFGSMSLVYHYRAKVSESLEKLYTLYSHGLLLISSAAYAMIVLRTFGSDPWVYASVSERPIWNLMSFAFAVPVLVGCLFSRFYTQRHQRKALAFSGLAAFILISLQIRHLWSGTINLSTPAASDGELYTYSFVWLVIALAAMLAGSWRFGQDVYRAGMALLALVIAKLFLVDMSDLEGLLRVASFMGLGLSLLGIHFLHQKLQIRPGAVE